MLRVRDLRVHFRAAGGRVVRAVDGVSLTLAEGETLGLVGESGCGKSTLSRAIVGLTPPTAGEVSFLGERVEAMAARRARALRRHLQMVFQDPRSSLNPRLTIGGMLEEPLLVHGLGDRHARRAAVREMLERVGLAPSWAGRLPHELSGGQAQRVAIARALILKPKLVVCDEAVSSLDVSIQAQILNLLIDLREEFHLSYLFVAHNLAVVRQVADRIAVMYLGRIVESGPAEEVFAAPRHPYTRSLVAAVVPAAPGARERLRQARDLVRGEPASPLDPPSGCAFRTRCPLARDDCAAERPPPQPVDPAGRHEVACHRWRESEEGWNG